MGGYIDSDFIIQFIVTLPALLVSMVFHEVSHGYVAYRLGDRTAFERGRLSLNPLRHLDTFGTLVLFLSFFSSGGRMLFGWAKPVPINPGRFESPQRGMMWVGLAGPTANFIMASACALLLRSWVPSNDFVFISILRVFQLNVILMAFNLIPVPPLDGSRIVGGFMSPRTYMKWLQLDQYGMVFIMILLFLLIGPLSTVFYEGLLSLYRLFLPSYFF